MLGRGPVCVPPRLPRLLPRSRTNRCPCPLAAVWHLLPAATEGRQLCLPSCAQLGNRAGLCRAHRSRPPGSPVGRPAGASRPRARLLSQPSHAGHAAACARHSHATADPVPPEPSSYLRQASVALAAGKRACGAARQAGRLTAPVPALKRRCRLPVALPAGGTRARSASRLCPSTPSRPSTATSLWPASGCVQNQAFCMSCPRHFCGGSQHPLPPSAPHRHPQILAAHPQIQPCANVAAVCGANTPPPGTLTPGINGASYACFEWRSRRPASAAQLAAIKSTLLSMVGCGAASRAAQHAIARTAGSA